MKKGFFALALCGVMCVSMVGCGGTGTTEPVETNPAEAHRAAFWTEGDAEENAAFEAFANELFVEEVSASSVNLHFKLRDYEAYGIERPVPSLLGESYDENYYTDKLAQLLTFEYDALSRENQIAYLTLKQDFESVETAETLTFTGTNFDPSSGMHTNLITVFTEYEFTCAEDIEDYLVYLSEVPEIFDLMVEDETMLVEQGYGLSDATLDLVIGQCEDVYGDGTDSPILSVNNEKIAELGLSASDTEDYQNRNKEAIVGTFLPAYRDLIEDLKAFKGKGTNDLGLSNYGEGGKDYYAYLLQSTVGYGGSVDDLFQGLQGELSAIYNELIDTLYASDAAFTAYETWMDWYYDGKGPLPLPTDPIGILDYFAEEVEQLFPSIGETTYSVKYVPEELQSSYANVLAYYLIPPIDDYLHGSITVNQNSDGTPAQLLMTLAHEGYPGHLYQNVYFGNSDPLPIRQLYSYNCYTEGWAVYSECEALRLYPFGGYSNYVYRFSKMDTYMNYILSAMVEIGVHYYGWTAEDVASFLSRNGMVPDTAEAFTQSVAMMPGVYISYGVGIYMMSSLRDYAEKAQGSDFDEVEFNTLILDIGPCTYDVLNAMVKEYYEAEA